MKNQQNKPLLRKKPILVLGFAIFILIISGGYFYYRYEKNIIRQEQYSDLKSIADLKISQIVHWREERLADARVFAESPFIRQKFQQWLFSRDTILENDLTERFSLLRFNDKYENVIIFSTGGKLLISLDTNLRHIDSEIISSCKKASQEKKAFLSDFYISSEDHAIHFDVFAPIMNQRNVPVAVLVLRVDPFDFLYPLFQSWPKSSKSAEILIIRKEGDSTLYVNELRHISNTALKLRIPLTSLEVPAVQAVLGKTGIIEGKDYRGVRVLADMRPVHGSPWFMIAKVDQSEIFSEIKYRTIIVIIITLLLLLFSGIAISWLFKNRQINIYKKLLETGTKLEETQIEFRTTLYSIGDAVITTDTKGYIRNMNMVSEKLTGWKESDGAGRNIGEVFNIINEESGEKVESPVLRVLKEGLIVGLANHTLLISKDGKKTPIADSGAPIRNEKGDITGVVLVFRDQTQEREAQRALKESERKFRETLKYLDEGYYGCTMEGILLEHNLAFNRILGIDLSKDMKGSKLPDFWLNPDERNAYLQELMTRGFTSNYLINAITITGEMVVVLVNSHLVKDEKGDPVRIEGTFADFTKLKQAQKELEQYRYNLEQLVADRTADLKRSEEKFRTVSDFAYNWEYWTDSDNRMLYVSPSCERITGFLPGNFYENHEFLEQIIYSDDRVIYNTHIRSFHGGKGKDEKSELEFRIVAKNGSQKWIGHSCAPVFGDNGVYLGRRASNRDITESKKAELLLQSQRDLGIILNSKIPLSEAFECVLDAAIELSGMDCGGLYILDDTSGAIDLVHYKGLPADFVTVSSHYSTDSPNNQLVMKGTPVYTTMPSLNIEKHEIEKLRAIAIIPMQAKGKVIGCLNVASHTIDKVPFDVRNGLEVLTIQISAALARIKADNEIEELNKSLTERTAKLEASNKELEAFSYSVSHDLRAPLRSIHSFTNILFEEYENKLDDEGKRLCGIIASDAIRMGGLIDDLLNFSKIGRSSLNASFLDMKSMIYQSFDEIASKNEKTRINLKIGKIKKAYGDAHLIRLVWNNLISNAIKYSSKKEMSEISIGSQSSENSITYYIKDNGVGFEMIYKHKLFGVFQRLHSGKDFEGNGVGLAIVQRIIRRHGGEVWAEAEVDKGATFYFSLPVQDTR